MHSRYKEVKFPELQDINNLEYRKVFLKLKIMRLIKRSKKIIPKLKKLYKSKVVKGKGISKHEDITGSRTMF